MAEEIYNQEQEFTQEQAEVEALAEEQNALVEYIPKSKAPYRLNTLIPRNMAFEVQKSLNRVIKLNGNIDNHVRNQLKYASVEALWKGLGAEQVDSIGLYLSQFEREEGIIIADQTGIGKGRQAAAVIRHAIVNDYLPVFFTRKPDLFSDLYRDLKSIAFKDINPFLLNTSSDAKVKDTDGHVIFSPLTGKEQEEYLITTRTIATESPESIEWHKKIGKPLPDSEEEPTLTLHEPLDHLPNEYDCIFTTYSQVQSAGEYKKEWLARIVNSGIEGSKKYKKVVFVLDESHMAGGFDSIIGTWMRNTLPKTKACCYLSATFAKYPQVMPFYGKKTAIQEAGLTDETFVYSMERGGLALQEIIASNLAESGQLIRRQRSNQGILVDYITLDKEPERSIHRESVNRIVKLMNEVVQFEKEYITPILDDLHRQAKEQGASFKDKPRGLGVKQAPYFSRVFTIIDQMLFSLKVKEVGKKTLQLLNEDKKVVIAFKSTMGSFLKDLNLTSGDEVLAEQLDFTRTLIKGLNSIFKYNYTSIDNSKSRQEISLAELPQSGIDRYNQIKKAMQAESTGLNISPIDELLQIIQSSSKKKRLGGHQGSTFKIGEVTGRNQRIRLDQTGGGTIESFKTDTEKFFRQFNNGELDVLLINQSGSTGSSAHASKEYKDQRVRAMIIHQFELDINTEVQKRGRINRTGQVVLPEYYYITSDIPAEKRLMTMLKGKMKSLDANTTGSQKTNEDTLKSPDFFNKYGDQAAWTWVNENPELTAKLGYPTYHKPWGKDQLERNGSKDGAIKQVTGRAGLLYVDEQEQIYEDLLKKYHNTVDSAKQQGTYDLEIEFLKLDADVKKRYLYEKGTGGKTVFGKDSVRDETIINNLKRPFTKPQIDQRIQKALKGDKPKQMQLALVEQVKQGYPAIAERLIKNRKETITNIQKELEELPKEAATEKEQQKLDRSKERLEDIKAQKEKFLSLHQEELEQIKNNIIRTLQLWTIGEVVKIPIKGTVLSSYGIFLEAKIAKAKNPYALSNITLIFLVADSRRILEFNLTPEQMGDIHTISGESKDLTEEEKQEVIQDWNALIQEASQKREKRYILTENILKVSREINSLNKLVKYNTKEGIIKSGILLHKTFGEEDRDKKALLPISNAQDHLQKLETDAIFSDIRNTIRFKRIGDKTFQIFLTKKANHALYTDEKLRSLLMKAQGQNEDELADFVQNAGDMTGAVHLHKLASFLERLDTFFITYLGEERALEDWEIENEKDWEKATQTKEGTHLYKMNRPYGQGSNPVSGFKNYQEPSPNYPFGVIEYNRPLNDKERFNYSLIPLFKNVEEPYQAWKKHLKKTPAIEKDFAVTIKKVKEKPLHEAILELGYFMTTNPHEDGNIEFVFGEYQEEALGQIAYEDQLGTPTELDKLIAQLHLALETA